MSELKKAESFKKRIQNNNELNFDYTIILEKRKKLSIVYGVIFVVVLILLYKYQPSFVLKEEIKEDDEEIYIEKQLSYYNLLVYSIFISLFLFGLLLFLSTKYEKIKELLF